MTSPDRKDWVQRLSRREAWQLVMMIVGSITLGFFLGLAYG